MRQETRSTIVARARELWNQQGIEAVGVRELARDLGLSPGNVSYHFAKKQDLVHALMDELRAKNATIHASASADASLGGFFARTRRLFFNQHEYRCLAGSIVYVTDAFPELAREYREVDRARRRALAAQLRAIRDAGELPKLEAEDDLARVVATCTLIARFWIPEARLSYVELSADDAVDHYLAVLAHALVPYASPRARKALAPLLARVQTSLALGG